MNQPIFQKITRSQVENLVKLSKPTDEENVSRRHFKSVWSSFPKMLFCTFLAWFYTCTVHFSWNVSSVSQSPFLLVNYIAGHGTVGEVDEQQAITGRYNNSIPPQWWSKYLSHSDLYKTHLLPPSPLITARYSPSVFSLGTTLPNEEGHTEDTSRSLIGCLGRGERSTKWDNLMEICRRRRHVAGRQPEGTSIFWAFWRC